MGYPFAIRWRLFGSLELENTRICWSESREAAEPLVNASSKQCTRIPDNLKIGDAMFARQSVTLVGDKIDLITAIVKFVRRPEYFELCVSTYLPFGWKAVAVGTER